MADLQALQQTLGITFHSGSLLEQALVHSSYLNENPSIFQESNERLEFLGDAVLGLIIAEKLYCDFPSLAEGEMTRQRAAIVRREVLARVARTINLGDYLYLGKGEEAGGGKVKTANLAGAVEALIAAVFLDQGLAISRACVLRLFDLELQKLYREDANIADFKSRLQEIVQSRQLPTPMYHLIEAIGPDHDKCFTIEVRTGDTILGQGSGKSKKLAEMEAARIALGRL